MQTPAKISIASQTNPPAAKPADTVTNPINGAASPATTTEMAAVQEPPVEAAKATPQKETKPATKSSKSKAPVKQTVDESMGLLSDQEIKAIKDLVTPFHEEIIRSVDGRKVISYGLGSYGYDIRLSAQDFRIYRQNTPGVCDPKNFDMEQLLYQPPLEKDSDGSAYFYLPPFSYCLGVAEERLAMPADLTAIGYGKSTYARSGINTFITPIESGWCGHLTIGIANNSPVKAKIYVNEGIAQLLFLRSKPCKVSYDDRQGKYQDQGKSVTVAKV